MIIGYFQYSPDFAAPADNLSRVEDALGDVEADIVVLPELAFTGYLFQDREELLRVAEDPDESRTVRRLISLCAGSGLHVVTGFAEQKGDKVYNSAIVLGPSGIVHRYRKLHLFGTEKEYFDPGDTQLGTWEVQGVRIGVMICFDWVFPEVARTLALQGADVLCHPSNLVLDYCQQAMRTRSLENAVYSITANRTGHESRPRGELRFTGQSQIVDPQGRVLACSGPDDQGLVLHEIDPFRARDKWMTPVNHRFADRRPEYYSLGS
ncbi:nitrilase-related carbon-nitrogen hydrolase [Desulfovermiculus halophilus]|jgi:predicted amidohydrolase|uniref:nitrilase-related carbon-nitrogen hydrolase n=1 Tax=Desulfovermiculus halophilus TaxID=339722 RepID=UPI00048222C6|nr:nitrilase-related carbon-nitrogen hydrolase [Desulfovermiculus halophilus]